MNKQLGLLLEQDAAEFAIKFGPLFLDSLITIAYKQMPLQMVLPFESPRAFNALVVTLHRRVLLAEVSPQMCLSGKCLLALLAEIVCSVDRFRFVEIFI